MGQIIIDPLTRIEGHLKIEAMVEYGVVKEARSTGTLFRGFEIILRGRDPRDAQRITQRICGVCPTSHSTAAALNLDSAFGIAAKIPGNGRILRNLILGAAHIADHILHFYHLSALDYVDIAALGKYEGKDPTLNSVKDFITRGELGPFITRYNDDFRLSQEANVELAARYLKAFEMRRKAQEAAAIFGGKLPHNIGIVPGGVTAIATVDKIASFLWRLNELRDFIDNVYLPDVIKVAKAYPDYLEIGAGCKRTLSYGVYELETTEADLVRRKRLFKNGLVSESLELEPLDISKIREEVRNSWYAEECAGKPTEGKTIPTPHKEGAYSWIKSPRSDGRVCEVGSLARVLATYVGGDPRMRELVDGALKVIGVSAKALFSTLGRHLARALGAKFIADSMPAWLLELKPGEPAYIDYEVPEESEGMGITEAARGALGHWIKIKDRKIALYQCVVPTTWNASPRDDHEQPGPIEQALAGIKIKDEKNPVEIGRIVRSFDPCLACAVHLLSPKGTEIGRVQVC
ncbi:MAG: nickel-dependent hydrogenase large subunit [Dehalococcoidia bacterium]|nr:nickel-dependent hydrogenase large subunit [Dehalococcoidia bacterium]